MTVRIAVSGASGKMGREIIQEAIRSKYVKLGAVLSRSNSGSSGMDIGVVLGYGPIGIKISDDLAIVKDDFDVLIDFTHPDTTLLNLDFCCENKKNIVIGTTGFNSTQKQYINSLSKNIGVVFSSNFSIIANLMIKLSEKAAQIIGKTSDVRIIDVHHRDKKDSPSGTSLSIKEAIASSIQEDFFHRNEYENFVNTQQKSIDLLSIRAGDIVGEHTVMFINIGERLEIIHRISSRAPFAQGAIYAASCIANKKNGMFDMISLFDIND